MESCICRVRKLTLNGEEIPFSNRKSCILIRLYPVIFCDFIRLLLKSTKHFVDLGKICKRTGETLNNL